ncbi:NAD(P)H-dependent oxidoreductase [Streptomyces sp. NPDC005840]|uniref:flavodoxin family protein n=1 Tax=Streptomyces sp. NPDC005840 TaxID=3157072 RepID=UPI0033FED5B5
MRVLSLACSLNSSSTPSSSHLLSDQLLSEFHGLGVDGETVRVADHTMSPGVEKDMGEGDAWPGLRKKLLAADILILATPIWLGHPSSVCQRVLERLDAELAESDEEGRLLTYGKVAGVVVVGNEDGAHKVSADESRCSCRSSCPCTSVHPSEPDFIPAVPHRGGRSLPNWRCPGQVVPSSRDRSVRGAVLL